MTACSVMGLLRVEVNICGKLLTSFYIIFLAHRIGLTSKNEFFVGKMKEIRDISNKIVEGYVYLKKY